MTSELLKHNELGAKGEEIAFFYLIKNDYKVLEKNWRFKHKEIDIIATKDNLLIIVEVKSRSNDYFEQPQDAVNRKKQKFIIDATNSYIEKFDIDMEVRFDIISVIFKDGKHKIEHIEDAFYPLV
ncbi:MAG: endonuclease [Bacteroidetes bacterium]|jgi:putative endonuclease|nr:endonuclease [Bacteroidota bacterium]MBT6686337.1 endonuclease [Bacteroidota bacterium]MBT7142170.1 endonuclease [Bacteroidota bacterium]MBT7490475.1 endonuclease [Bacteroidota bacterium]